MVNIKAENLFDSVKRKLDITAAVALQKHPKRFLFAHIIHLTFQAQPLCRMNDIIADIHGYFHKFIRQSREQAQAPRILRR